MPHSRCAPLLPCLTAALAFLASLLDVSRVPAGEITNDGSLGTMSLNFNFRFEPTPAEVDDVKVAVQDASEILCDATDGQLVIGDVQLTIAGAIGEEAKADIWFLPQEGRSYANFYPDGSMILWRDRHVTLFNDDLYLDGNAFGGVIAHELSHYALGLGDEYDEQCRGETGCGIGPCFDDGAADEANHCLMQNSRDWTQPGFRELCVLGNHDLLQGESGGDDLVCGVPDCADSACGEPWCSSSWNSETERFEVTHHQLVHPGKSCWEALVENHPFISLPANLPVQDPPTVCSTPVQFRDTLVGLDQIMLVMDTSGSMRTAVEGGPATRLYFAQAAARGLVDFFTARGLDNLVERNVAVGVASFSTFAFLNERLTELDSVDIQGGVSSNVRFKNTITDLEAFGLTSTGLGLRVARTHLESLASMGRSRTVILLTDGHDNPLLPGLITDAKTEAERLKAIDAAIITVPVGIGADRELLAELATISGGEMVDAPVGDELPAIYAEIVARLRNWDLSLHRTPSLVARELPQEGSLTDHWFSLAGLWSLLESVLPVRWTPSAQAQQTLPEMESFPFLVEEGAETLHVFLSSRNADVTTWNPGFRLLGPAGEVIEDDAPDILFDDAYRIIMVGDPSPGTWTLEVFANSTIPQASFVLAFVENEQPDCLVSAFPRTVGPGGTVTIGAEASFIADLDGPITFEGSVRRPDGSVVSLSFARDVLTGANTAAFDDFVGRGAYDVTVQCSVGTDAHVRRGEPIFDGPDFDPPVEPFERTGRATFFLDVDALPPCVVADCDGDGIPNVDEGTDDIDGDGLPCDRDDDCDGDDLADADEGTGDADGDGIPNFQDPDADDDCMPDGADAAPTTAGPPVCGDSIVCPGEECDGQNDAACPGLCAPGGAADACTCRPRDHYKCYKTRQVDGRFSPRTVDLEDELAATSATVTKPRRFCNPVDKNGEGIDDPTAHLMCYQIEEPGAPKVEVVVENQFGEQRLAVTRADSLCVPAEKDAVPSDLQIDHFKCYKVKQVRGGSRFTQSDVDLEDQFETKSTQLVRPRFLCNPVDKNGEGLLDPDAHLVCYRIVDAPGQSKFRRTPVDVTDQFAEQGLKTLRGDCRQSSFLCVPSTARPADATTTSVAGTTTTSTLPPIP